MISNMLYKKLYKLDMKQFLSHRNEDFINLTPKEFDHILTKFLINLDKINKYNNNLDKISNLLNK